MGLGIPEPTPWPSGQEAPSTKGTEMDMRDAADMGFEDGWNAAMDEVSRMDYGHPLLQRVWARLADQLAPALAARKAKRAVRDQYAAEIAARASAPAS